MVDKNKIPAHIAIIMDGNGRWAARRGEPRFLGHKKGVDAVKRIVDEASSMGVQYLTLYTFSAENWKRPEAEIKALMSILITALNSEIERLKSNNIRILAIGNIESLPYDVQETLRQAIRSTSRNTGLSLVLALSYSGRQDIIYAVQKINLDIRKKKISLLDISAELLRNYLSTANIPDPELLIRTGGEYRISNFLLWELAYTEFYFTRTLWPDFDKEEFREAIIEYQSREKRFGKTSEQVRENNY
ncbi:MAG: isoprenyl transferase [Synergistaceae bacterium]|jgi:undecaprenyl diphosphate synthase|nr:isoprenyl transferase [Synergistaceae bacterium]MDD3077124.1 isoprenyl transferase [Proteiniphilum sp.]MDD3956950.1 isoprenyl transferase [Proteiniphilum sp.]